MTPKHHELRLPALTTLNDGVPRKKRDIETPRARIAWELSYFSNAGLTEKPQTGVAETRLEINPKVLNTPILALGQTGHGHHH